MTRFRASLEPNTITAPVGEWWVAYDPRTRRITQKPTLVFPDEIYPRGTRMLAACGGGTSRARRFRTQKAAKAWVQSLRAQWRQEDLTARSRGEQSHG